MNLLLAACLLTTTFAQAQTTVNVEKAGTLSEQIGDDMKYQITSLKVTGQLNGTDFVLLRDMAGINLTTCRLTASWLRSTLARPT